MEKKKESLNTPIFDVTVKALQERRQSALDDLRKALKRIPNSIREISLMSGQKSQAVTQVLRGAYNNDAIIDSACEFLNIYSIQQNNQISKMENAFKNVQNHLGK